MRIRWPAITVVVGLGVFYFAYPYATLWRLDSAIRHADAATIETMVDWYAVREGLKEDICDMAFEDAGADTHIASGELPPFGAGFVRGIAGNAVDQAVTAETVASMSQGMSHGATRDDPNDAVLEWAFFQNPTVFTVSLRTAGSSEPIRVMMELRNMRWKVRRVFLPGAILERAGSHT